MKIRKELSTSLFIKTFGLKDKIYFTGSVFVMFDLLRPDKLYKEQELWQDLTETMGNNFVFDIGMPKPRAEFLVVGSCFAPKGETVRGSEVSVRVGNKEKRLYVFGNRYWVKKSGFVSAISEPEPFSEMKINWQNAFGGKNFEYNPLGKGIKTVVLDDGRKVVPLPNVEYPDSLITSPKDRPNPASFYPIDITWPQRYRKKGTYDEKWLKERWPYFPDDMNFEIFNMASEDQMFDGFLKGDEEIEIVNMHPEHRVINSRLPNIRPRFFIYRKLNLKKGFTDDNLIFEELNLNIDTVWLFPTILKGIVIFRGAKEVLDEDFDDIYRLYIVLEKREDEPKSVEYYFEEHKKAFSTAVEINKKPIIEAQKTLNKASADLRKIAKKLAGIKSSFDGNTPIKPTKPPHVLKRDFSSQLNRHEDTLDKIINVANNLNKRFSQYHIFPTEKLEKIREKLNKQRQNLDDMVKEHQKANKSKKEALSKLYDDFNKTIKKNKENIPEDQLKKIDSMKNALEDFDNSFLLDASQWEKDAYKFLNECYINFLEDEDKIKELKQLGLEYKDIDEYFLGLNLKKRQIVVDGKKVEIPEAVVIPIFEGKNLKGLIIREGAVKNPTKRGFLEGSEKENFFIEGAITIELEGIKSYDAAPVLRVDDELEAIKLEKEIGDISSIVVMGKPDDLNNEKAKDLISKAHKFFVVVYDNENFNEWKEKYPNVYEVKQKDLDNIREIIFDNMPDDFNEMFNFTIDEENPTKFNLKSVFPPIDIKKAVDGLLKHAESKRKEMEAQMKAKMEEVEKQAKEEAQKFGVDEKEFERRKKEALTKSFEEESQRAKEDLLKLRDRLKDVGQLTPENEEKIRQQEELIDKSLNMHREGEQKFKEVSFFLEKLKDLRSGKKVKGLKVGDTNFDELVGRLKRPLTREEVIEKYKKGESFEGEILSKLNLSGLDLKGIKLKRAICNQTDFTGCNLEGALVTSTVADSAIFKNANLRGAKVDSSTFTSANFEEADLSSARIEKSSFAKANLNKVKCENSYVNMSIYQNAQIEGVQFSTSHIKMSIFTDCSLKDSNFKDSILEKCSLLMLKMDNLVFENTKTPSTQFLKCKGNGNIFRNCDLTKIRFIESQLENTQFLNCNLTQASFSGSNFKKSDFSGSSIKMGLLDKTDLSESNFKNIDMPKTRLIKCNLEKSDMEGVNLMFGSLRKSRIVNTNLNNSNLFGVDFYKVTAGKTQLRASNTKRTLIHGKEDLLKQEPEKEE